MNPNPYTPRRDYRFEYISDAIHFIEERQCGMCKYRETDDPEQPACLPISGKFFDEEPMEEIQDLGDRGIGCLVYEYGDPA